jgi:hypothetical protein
MHPVGMHLAPFHVVWRHGDGDVVPIHQAHVVEVLRRGRGCERDLRCSRACHRSHPSCNDPAHRIELATLPAPHATGSPGREADGGGVVGRQLHPTAH